MLEETFLVSWNHISDFYWQDDRVVVWMAGTARRLALQALQELAVEKAETEVAIFVPALNGIALN